MSLHVRRQSRPKSNHAASLRMKHNSSKNLDVYKASSLVSKMRSRSKSRKKSPKIVKPESPPPPTESEPPNKSETQQKPNTPEPEESVVEEVVGPAEEAVPDKLVEFLTCYVCQTLFSDPKTLTCLHTFCKSCLQFQDCEDNKNSISCPLCKEVSEVNDIDNLEATPFVEHMIKLKAAENMAKSSQVVTENKDSDVEQSVKVDSESEKAKIAKDMGKVSMDSLGSGDTDVTQPVYCDECKDTDSSTCSLCSTKEQLSTTVLAENQPKIEERKPDTCIKHEEEILDYFCSKCDCFICIECLITEHPHFQHGVSKVHDVAPRYKEVLGMLKMEAEFTAPELSRASEVYQTKASWTEQKLDQIKDKIRERKEEILTKVNDLLEQQEKRLLDQLSNAVMWEKKDYLDQAARLEDDQKVLKCYCCLTENLISHGNSFEVMETKTELIKRMHRICVKGKDPYNQLAAQNDEKITIKYEVGNPPILNKDNSLGYLHAPKAYGPKTTASGHGLVDVKCGHMGVFSITTKDRQGQELESGGALIGLKIITSSMEEIDGTVEDHEDGTYTVSYTTTILGPHIVSVTVGGIPIMGSPFTVNAVISENYNLRDEPLMIIGGEKIGLCDPTGIATDSSNQIYIVDRGNNRVLVCSDKGKPVLTIDNSDTEKNRFQSPLDVSISKTKIIVTDSKNNRIQVFDKDGTFLHSIGKYGEDDGELKEPNGVAVDSKGNIVVADTMNHRVQIFRESGEFVSNFGRLGTKEGEFRFPSGVVLDKSGNIIVCDSGLWEESNKENNNRIQVFNTNGEYLYEFGTTGQDNGQFKKPARVAVDKKGRLLVTDMENNRIQVFKANGTFLCTIVNRGISNSFNGPCGIAVMQDGRVVTTERRQNQVQMF